MTITIQCTNISSNLCAADFAADVPDMIEFDAPSDFDVKVQKCVDLMRTNTIREMVIEHAFVYRLYQDVKRLPADDFGVESVTCGSANYAPFEPSHKISGCNARIDVTGEITVVLPVGDSGGEIVCALGNRPF
jgi:hypothetical protein